MDYKILISGIGGTTPISLAKTLKTNSKYGTYKIFGTDCNRIAIGLYKKQFNDQPFLVPKATDKNYWDIIKDIIKKEKIDAAIIQPEVEVLEWGLREEWPCPVLIPSYNLAKVLQDKAEMASVLEGSKFIPKTIKIKKGGVNFKEIENKIGYPCWIRATKGSGGFGSLKIDNRERLKAWLFINPEMKDFTISEFLPGRHIATKLLYFNGELIKGASLECIEYVMANISPSGVTGNTSFGRFINNSEAFKLSLDCIDYISKEVGGKANGVLSVDLKEDKDGIPKITEINIRHMAYTGCLAQAGVNLVEDMVQLTLGNSQNVEKTGEHIFDKNYIFLRDVDTEPIVMEESNLLK